MIKLREKNKAAANLRLFFTHYYISYYYVLLQNHYYVLLHHYYTIITSLLHHYYFIITKGKSCNNDYIITCYAKSKPLLLHYYYVLLRNYYTRFYYYRLLPISVSQTCRWHDRWHLHVAQCCTVLILVEIWDLHTCKFRADFLSLIILWCCFRQAYKLVYPKTPKLHLLRLRLGNNKSIIVLSRTERHRNCKIIWYLTYQVTYNTTEIIFK